MIMFRWYSEVFHWCSGVFHCSATVLGCSAVPPVFCVPAFGVPAFLVLQYAFPVYAICNILGAEKSKGLLFFHAFTGCNKTLFFANYRKKSTWSTWHDFDEVPKTFIKLSCSPTIKAVMDGMPVLEQFVVLMYDQTSNCLDVNSCRHDLFVKKGQVMEALLPTLTTLLQHSFRAAYQAGHVWRQS